jgi:hypothetical protein
MPQLRALNATGNKENGVSGRSVPPVLIAILTCTRVIFKLNFILQQIAGTVIMRTGGPIYLLTIQRQTTA